MTNVGIIGCGDILDAYMLGLDRFGARTTIRRLADVDLDRATTSAERYSVASSGGVDEMWADDEVEIVVSLTPPVVHHELINEAAAAGKDIYTEKPLSATTDLARAALAVADQSGIRVASAPDTFLGSAPQTARAALDEGEIGEIIAVSAFAPYNRAERRHPNPGFLFQAGAGPLLDIAPYHVSWLVTLLGAVSTVAGLSRRSGPIRKVPTPEGTIDFPVEVDTHVTSILEFASGVVGTFVGSFDVWSHRLPAIEIYGSLGTLSLPHPNWYDGDVELKRHDDAEWQVVEPVFEPIQNHPTEKVRGLGVVDLIDSRNGAPNRTNSTLAFHTLEVLEAMQSSSRQRGFVTIESKPDRPPPLSPQDLQRWRP